MERPISILRDLSVQFGINPIEHLSYSMHLTGSIKIQIHI